MGNGLKNLELYPRNLHYPEERYILDNNYKIFKSEFRSMHDLQRFLRQDLEINEEVFDINELASSDNYDMDKVIKNLTNNSDPNYREFLRVQQNINSAIGEKSYKLKTKRSPVGSHIVVPAYVAGSPKMYSTTRMGEKSKVIRLYVNLSYLARVNKSQVYNKGLIIGSLVKALERKGYIVDVKGAAMSSNSDEISYVQVNLKDQSGNLNLPALYQTTCKEEFLRGVVFRIREITPFKTGWGWGYGRTCSEEMGRQIFNIGKNDIYISSPDDLGIRGYDLAEDFEQAINHLELDKVIETEKIKKIIKKSTNK